ncbi:MAG: HNH endonuclease [Thermoguttaceae bacterium]
MPTYILTWNPKRWPWPEEDYNEEVAVTKKGKLFPGGWTCGNTTRIVSGDRVFLLRQVTERGIIQSGYATSEVYETPHWEKSRKGDTVFRIAYESERLLPVEERLPIERLIKAGLGVHWDRILASGVGVPEEHAFRLEKLWEQHLAKLKRRSITPFQQERALAALEGDSYRGEATFRRRNRALIEDKKRMSDGRCSVCRMKFSERYKGIRKHCLVAHHVKPIGKRKTAAKTTLDEIDLLCPNCHTAVHTTDRPLTAAKLRIMLAE